MLAPIQDYENELQSLFDYVQKDEQISEDVVRARLTIKKYREEELRLLNKLATSKFLTAIRSEPPFEYASHNSETGKDTVLKSFDVDTDNYKEWYGIDNVSWDYYYTIILAIQSLLSTQSQEQIPDRFLCDPKGQSRNQFIQAEQWARDNGYIDEDGSWNPRKYKTRLSAFIGYLIGVNVFNHTNEKDVDEYLSERYKVDGAGGQTEALRTKKIGALGTQAKRHKMITHEHLHEFHSIFGPPPPMTK